MLRRLLKPFSCPCDALLMPFSCLNAIMPWKAVYDQFVLHRKQGRQIGPCYMRQAIRREVNKVALDESCELKQRIAARAFRGGSRWLQRFCKRWNIVLRRKTNVKKVPNPVP